MSWFCYMVVPSAAVHDAEAFARAHGLTLVDKTREPWAARMMGKIEDARLYDATGALAFHEFECIPRGGKRREAQLLYRLYTESADYVRRILAMGGAPVGLMFFWVSGSDAPVPVREQVLPVDLLEAAEVFLLEGVCYIVE